MIPRGVVIHEGMLMTDRCGLACLCRVNAAELILHNKAMLVVLLKDQDHGLAMLALCT